MLIGLFLDHFLLLLESPVTAKSLHVGAVDHLKHTLNNCLFCCIFQETPRPDASLAKCSCGAHNCHQLQGCDVLLSGYNVNLQGSITKAPGKERHGGL